MAETNESKKHTKSNEKWVVVGVVSLLVLVLIGVAVMRGTKDGAGDYVAIVNGEEITQEAFDARLQSELDYYSQAAGAALAESEREDVKAYVLDGLINEIILAQQAKKEGIEVSEDELNSALAQIEAENTPEDIENLGYDTAGLRTFIERRLLMEQYVDAYIAGTATSTISDEEIERAYEEYSSQTEEPEDLEIVRDALEAELLRQQVIEAFTVHLAALREQAEIVTQE